MNKKKFIVLVVFMVFILVLIYFYTVKSMNAFNSQQFNEEKFLMIKNDVSNQYHSYINKLDKDDAIQVTLALHNIIPPKNSQIQIYSHKLSESIYLNSYQSTLRFKVDKKIFENDSLDSLVIRIIDPTNKTIYTIEQEKAFEVWKEGKIVNIWFLPFRQYDEETGRGIGYTISLS